MWTPPDPVSGWSRDVPPLERTPQPGTATVAHRQRQEAERRLAAGETRDRDDVDAEANRRSLRRAFRLED